MSHNDSFESRMASILDCFSSRPQLDEILFNGPSHGQLISRESSTFMEPPFNSAMDMLEWLQQFCGIHNSRLDPNRPAAGGSYAPNFRWHAIHPCVSPGGPLFSLRKHRFGTLKLNDFVISDIHLSQISSALEQGDHLLLYGETGSGKSSLLYCLLERFCLSERLIIIESLRELILTHPHWISLLERSSGYDGQGGFSCQQLISEALRLRPDRIVLGEIRNAEIPPYLELLQIGHRGVIATVHGHDPKSIMSRFMGHYNFGNRDRSDFSLAFSGEKILFVKILRGLKPKIESASYLVHGAKVPKTYPEG